MISPTLLLVMVLAAGAAAGVCLIVAGLRPKPSEGVSALGAPSRLSPALRRLRGPLLGPRVVLGLGAGLLVLIGADWPVAAVAIAALIVCWPLLFGAARAQRDRIAELEALAMWTESLKDLVSGAAGLREAIPISVDTAAPVLRAPLTRLRGLLAARESLATALPVLAADLGDPTAELVVAAALILNARSRGPGLAHALGGLSESIREELELARRIEAGRRGDRRSVQIIVAVTCCFGAGMAFLFPPQFSHPYRTVIGQGVLLIIIAIFAASFAWMRRLAAPDVPDLFLSDPPGVGKGDSDPRSLIPSTRFGAPS
jgi:Flp pilus assembly protein TadB